MDPVIIALILIVVVIALMYMNKSSGYEKNDTTTLDTTFIVHNPTRY
jgi:hypothetical protein